MIKHILIIAISAIFINNFIFIKFFGLSSFLGLSKKPGTIFGIGMTITLILIVTGFLNSIFYQFVLVQLSIEFLKTPVFIITISFIILLLIVIIKQKDNVLYKSFGKYLPMTVSNSIILGICLITIQQKYDLLSSVLNGFFSGISFMIAIFIISTIREKLELSDIPKPFKGIPIALITMGIVSMILFSVDANILEFLK
jgi:Na+-translocating ferredoxin:NAD+ oxidoreductase subunit A